MNAILKYLFFLSLTTLLSCGNTNEHSEEQKEEVLSTSSGNNKVYRQEVLIHHESYGEGPLTLLFVHGWCINQSYWSEQVEAFRSNYKVVTIDLPGFGESGRNREKWSVENYGEDINAVIKQLNLSNVILIGHSMGGDVILEAALKNKEVIALIGVDNFKDVGMEFNDEVKVEIDGFMNLLKSDFPEVAGAYAEGALFHPRTDSLVKTRVIKDIKNSDPAIAISSLENLFTYGTIESKQLSSLKQKLYLINSDATPTNIAGLDATGVGYKVIPISATGHYPMIEKPAEFNRLLKQAILKIIATE